MALYAMGAVEALVIVIDTSITSHDAFAALAALAAGSCSSNQPRLCQMRDTQDLNFLFEGHY